MPNTKKYRFIATVLVLCVSVLFCARAEAQSAPRVVATIAPLHSLVAGVMEGRDQPEVLLTGNESPHGFLLKPSHIRKLNEADMVFYIDGTFETFLSKALESLPESSRAVAVSGVFEMEFLKMRSGGMWEEEGGGHEGHAHHHGGDDMHLWLSVDNAKTVVRAITKELSKADPKGKSTYKKNARAMMKKLDALDSELREKLAGLGNSPYIVFHDAYGYFEKEYGLKAVGSISVNPEIPPSAAKIREVRGKLDESGAVCVFSEPQFKKKVVDTVIEGTDVRTGQLDPLGFGIDTGPELYFKLMRKLADSVTSCLKG